MKVTVAKIIDNTSGNWWCKLYNVEFKVLSIRQETVIVNSCIDEHINPPYNMHEFPLDAVEMYEAISFPH